jgi:hypothetical protein
MNRRVFLTSLLGVIGLRSAVAAGGEVIRYKWVLVKKTHVRQNADSTFAVTFGPERVWMKAPYVLYAKKRETFGGSLARLHFHFLAWGARQ